MIDDGNSRSHYHHDRPNELSLLLLVLLANDWWILRAVENLNRPM